MRIKHIARRCAALQAPLQLLLLLLLARCSCGSTEAGSKLFVTDADMGIYTYDTIIPFQERQVNIRVQLRFLCDPASSHSSGGGFHPSGSGSTASSGISVEGFVGSFLITTDPPAWTPGTPHYFPFNIQEHVHLSISSRDGSVQNLNWVGPRDWGLWRVHADLSGPGPFTLDVGSSSVLHPLPHPLCPRPEGPGVPNLAGGIWNVLTTTSNSTLTANTLGFLTMQHNSYHRSLGLRGTILRSNQHESRALLKLPHVRRAVMHENLIIWPWEHEHVATWSTHFWQRPKNQLTLLGGYSRGAQVSYFDFDEFLVLDSGADVLGAQCDGRRLLDPGSDGRTGSWTFLRFQAKTCPHDASDLPCWEQGRSVSAGGNIELLHDLCPMSTMHGKQIVSVDMVDTVGVHFTHSDRFVGNQMVNSTCGHLLHLYSLVEGRRAGVTNMLRSIPPLSWNVDPLTGRRHVVWPEGLSALSHETCSSTPGARVRAVSAYHKKHKSQAQQPAGHHHPS